MLRARFSKATTRLTHLLSALAIASLSACSSTGTAGEGGKRDASIEVMQASEVVWEHLNPARGDKAPKAGTLWGDRNGTGPTGFLLRPSDGFQSPPHTHNVSYRGVVIRGLIHNDDPNADRMWMPAGSFWTQPKGGVHITAAKGSDTLAYIEIEEGPYLVLPVEDEFHSGEVPINVDESNIVWLDASNIVWLDQPGVPASGPKVAFLWGNPQRDQLNGTLVKLPAGFNGVLRSHGSSLRAVVIQGQLTHGGTGEAGTALAPGSYFSSQGKSVHRISCETAESSIIYVRMDGKFDVMPTESSR